MAAPAPASIPGALVLVPGEIEALTGGQLINATGPVTVRGAAIDSRAVSPGRCFVCLPGEKVDGHDFAAAAVAAGASLVIANRPLTLSAPVLVVADPVAALARLATEFRIRHACPTWIAVTGSNGKTTTKELIAAAMGASGRPGHRTKGNLNNHLGVPLTVLETPADAAWVVIELGANHRGEIASLATICRPTHGVVCSLGPAHIEGFGSLEGVVQGKSELFAALPADASAMLGLHGLAVHAKQHGFPLEALLAQVETAARGRHLTMIGSPEHSIAGKVDADGILLRTPAGERRLALLGEHNLANATLAWLTAVAAGVDGIRALDGLALARPVSGRLDARPLGIHRLIDDSYNANPASMLAALEVLIAEPGEHLAVLGGMAELGVWAADAHRRIGEEVARRGLPLVAVGELALPMLEGYLRAGGPDGIHHATKEAALNDVLSRLARAPMTVLVKASRSAGLEAIVSRLVSILEPGSRPLSGGH